MIFSNDEVELAVATDYGPRVTRYARKGGRNVFGEISPEEQGKDTPYGDRWHIYGGHRLWYAPEADPRSYYPDNQPVKVESRVRGVTLTQNVETHSRLEKSIDVELAAKGSGVTVTHRLTNRGDFTLEIAPWALTVMARGGRAFALHPRYVPHPDALAPARPLVTWPFTRMADPRWRWGDRLIELRQDPHAQDAQKIGLYDHEGFLAYALDDLLFAKTHTPKPGAHADFGCNVEIFTNELILELETLGPLVQLAPGATVEHVERWALFAGVELPDDEIARERALRDHAAVKIA